MMFVSQPIVDHSRVAVGRVDDHPRPGGRRRVAVEDPDLVVVQVDVVELRVERPERLAERRVERVDRAVAVGRGVEDLAVDLDLDRRLGEELAARALLDEAGVVDDPERRGVVRLVAADQELEARLGALEREALALELLDELAQDLAGRRRRRAGGRAARPGSRVFARPPSSLTTSRPCVADRGRVDVLVAPLDLGDRGAVDAALVGERRPADVRLVVVRGLMFAISATDRLSSVSPASVAAAGRHQLVAAS